MAHKKRQAPATEPLSEPSGDAESFAEQSGDLQGLSETATSSPESVRELAEDGQFFEAAVVSGIEDAEDADVHPVRVHSRKMDDVPPEYTDAPSDEPREE
jgi:hypothetical protein